MSGNRRLGNQAEAFVAKLLQNEWGENGWVVPLQQDYGADLIVLWVGGWRLYEVKSSKLRRQALTTRLTTAEQGLFDAFHERCMYEVIRVLRIPGRPGVPQRFEVLSRGA